MIAALSPHAQALLSDILFAIADARCEEDAQSWHAKIFQHIATLESFPESCPNIPLECFETIPPDPERLHQLIVKPYRIVYEVVGEEVHILSIRHGRQLVTIDDTSWR